MNKHFKSKIYQQYSSLSQIEYLASVLRVNEHPCPNPTKCLSSTYFFYRWKASQRSRDYSDTSCSTCLSKHLSDSYKTDTCVQIAHGLYMKGKQEYSVFGLIGFLQDRADEKVLEMDQCIVESFTCASQVGCYRILTKEYIYSNTKTKKNHNGGF